jgi:UDP-glucose 4-epimerase
MIDYLVTGSSGFLGRQVIQTLPETVTVQALAGRQNLDICDAQAVAQLPESQHILHLAGVSGLSDFEQDLGRGYAVNVTGTLNLLQHAARTRAKTFVFASTYMYGTPTYLPIDENHPIAYVHAYHHSKNLAEQLCLRFAEHYGFKVFILRLFNLYGPGQSRSMLIPTIIEQLQNAQIQLRDPSPRRDYLYVSDAAHAILNCCSDSAKPGTYNIGFGQSLSVEALVNKIQQLAGTQLPVTYTHQVRHTEVSDVVADTRLARAHLQWQAQTGLTEGLRRTLCAF